MTVGFLVVVAIDAATSAVLGSTSQPPAINHAGATRRPYPRTGSRKILFAVLTTPGFLDIAAPRPALIVECTSRGSRLRTEGYRSPSAHPWS